MTSFAAIDFETANYDRDSACAIGVVVCAEGRIVERQHHLIRPPSERFVFTYLHGIGWEQVAAAPSFGELWPTLRPLLRQVDFLAAHNASFDRSVLHACCQSHGLPALRKSFTCTVDLARRQLSIYPTKLPDVCRRLRIDLRHHQADSDAEACARIVLAAEQEGWRHPTRPPPPARPCRPALPAT
ncbi:MAG: 3'-5' exonuclease [Kiloniellales bacterium]